MKAEYTIHTNRDDMQAIRPWHWWIEISVDGHGGGTLTPGGREWSEQDAKKAAIETLETFLRGAKP